MDLNAPLGQKPPPHRRSVMPWVGAAVVVILLGGLGFYLAGADPHGGEPFAVAVIPPAAAPLPVVPPSAPDTTPTGSIGTPDAPAADTTRMENGVKVVSPGSPEQSRPRDSGPLVIDVTKALDGAPRRTAAVDALPRNNAAPGERRSVPKPMVAIFVGGMGLNPLATQTAITTMPAAVTLAFVPYGSELRANVDAARARGHEILLQLPMDTPGAASPGPHTLRADEPPDEMARDLTWLMGRFDGFDGVTNLLGASFTANQGAMTPVLRNVGQHGLFYLDDGTSRRSVAPALARNLGVNAVQADVVLDATANPAVVRANLDRLAALARTKGSAIGMASGFPDHLPAIARFAAELDAQGLTLVPVSAIANGGARLATTR